ncbi:hypothetical protein Anapl_12023 [Anas platyrhynchos]|uniref:Uncharacterized protein n=1 Tax=Anas platyrhynchos TaxID=8839 RepID=R0KDY7_ANAPL|nr:hypothetical protein Anapl_12023 [Anas platyrhynchos]
MSKVLMIKMEKNARKNNNGLEQLFKDSTKAVSSFVNCLFRKATTYLDVSVHMLRFLSQLRVVHRTHRHQKLKADLDQDAFQTHYLLFRHIELSAMATGLLPLSVPDSPSLLKEPTFS